MTRALRVGISVFTVLVVLTAAGVYGQRSINKPVHTVSIDFPTASGLVAGSDVLEAGAKVGSISAITPRQNDTARVNLQITDEHWPLHRGVQAAIRPKSLLGEKYVDIHDGSSRGPAYDARQVIRAAPDSTPVELDQFINSLDEPARAALKVLVNSAGAGLAGRGGDLNAAIKTGKDDLEHLARTGQTLNNRDPDLDRIIVGLDGVLSRITTDDQLAQMSQLITNGQQTLNAIEAEQATFRRSFVDSQAALIDLNAAIDPSVNNLRDLLNIAPDTLRTLGSLADVLGAEGNRLTAGSNLTELEHGLLHGPTVSGGALEINSLTGKRLPIFRICAANPNPQNHDQTQGCIGNSGFTTMGAESLPASYDGASGAMSAFADFVGV